MHTSGRCPKVARESQSTFNLSSSKILSSTAAFHSPKQGAPSDPGRPKSDFAQAVGREIFKLALASGNWSSSSFETSRSDPPSRLPPGAVQNRPSAQRGFWVFHAPQARTDAPAVQMLGA
ncbi:hypothetical protein GX51_06815 [Blastomyces parvus]|uniref:Uncharacterized protein n=1 Tax=Blastomyces parvus TaxID=2060905 RepID=A0A2B7WP61_9EURO|nr:hypothetical protein GX51_06815 [Blastomyces parvus]